MLELLSLDHAGARLLADLVDQLQQFGVLRIGRLRTGPGLAQQGQCLAQPGDGLGARSLPLRPGAGRGACIGRCGGGRV